MVSIQQEHIHLCDSKVCHSILQQLRIRTVPEPELLHEQLSCRNRPEHKSEQLSAQESIHSSACEAGRRFHQQL